MEAEASFAAFALAAHLVLVASGAMLHAPHCWYGAAECDRQVSTTAAPAGV